MTIPREIELKLELDPADGARRIRNVLRRAFDGPGETRRLRSRYFDTPDLALRKAALVLRLREDGSRRIQTLKAADGTSLLERPEWEVEVADDVPDLRAFGDAELPVDAASLGTLAPLFETRVERTIWRVTRDGAEIEVAFDTGEVVAGAESTPIREIELELKAGGSAALFDIARELSRTLPLRIGMRSKSERGFGLAKPEPSGPAKAEKVRLPAEASAAEAFRTVAFTCIRHFRLNEPQVLGSRDPEALHQARVAMRRLRSAFTLFKPLVAGAEARRLTAILQRLSAGLGEARNLDVYLSGRAAAEAGQQPDGLGLPELRDRLASDREAAYDRVQRHLRSARLRLAMIDLVAFLEAGDWLTDEAKAAIRDEPARTFAARVLDRRRRKVVKAGRHLEALDPPARHQVRIEAKKLRYASEFFRSLFHGKPARRRHRAFVSALETLQGCLGQLNDIVTGHEMALAIATETGGRHPYGPPVLLFALGHLSGEADAQEQRLVATAADAHRRLRHAKRFWT